MARRRPRRKQHSRSHSEESMRLIFIYGKPATGKLTVAEELEKLTGYKLFHNHLVVDLLLSTFEFGSEPFVRLREEIWLAVFREASRAQVPGLIFTFNPEKTVRAGFVEQAAGTVANDGGRVDFVELVCPVDELRRRVASESRLKYRKLSSVELFDRLESEGEFETAHMPLAAVTIDTCATDPAEAAEHIRSALGIPIAPVSVRG
jgi:chloramphenicol 3-O-phosphotransferase